MMKSARWAGILTALTIGLWAAPAHAAGPGDTLLLSGPSGSSPVSPSLFAWNVSGNVEEPEGESTQNVTPDGRYVVFTSEADGLLGPGDDPAFTHVFRKDMVTGALVTVDAGANGDSTNPDISDDGRYVVFASRASNLAAGDTAHDADVFVKDLQTGTVTLISASSSGTDCLSCTKPVISGDGVEAVFDTTTSLVAGDTNGKDDVYAESRSGGTPTLISAKPGGTTASNGASSNPSISDNHADIAYISTANDLDPTHDTTTDRDLYVRVLLGTDSFIVSAQNGNPNGLAAGGVEDGQISGDGLSVVFSDSASYLVADSDTNDDVYKRVLATQVDSLVSVNSSGTKGNGFSFRGAEDSTGRFIAFTSGATNLGGTGGSNDLFIRDTTSGTTTNITNGSFVSFPAVTHGSGNRVVFTSGSALADGPTPSAVHSVGVDGSGLALVSRPASGGALVPGLTDVFVPEFDDTNRTVSGDGRYAVFTSSSPALGGPPDQQECWRRDLLTGQLLLVSAGPSGPVRSCIMATISSDGQRIAFVTGDPLDPSADSGTDGDIYVHDVATGANTLVTRANGASGGKANGIVNDAEISGDGQSVAFISTATNLGVSGAGPFHVYLRNLTTGMTQVIDRATDGSIATSAADNGAVGVNSNGTRVAFATGAKLDPALDTDSFPDVYVRDVAAGTTTLVSRQSASAGGAKGTTGSQLTDFSEDGDHVLFSSTAQNVVPSLAPWPASAGREMFMRDLAAQTTTMVSTGVGGTVAGDGDLGGFAALDANGDTAAFQVDHSPTPSNMAPGVDGSIPYVVARSLPSGANLAVVEPGAIGGGSFSSDGARSPSLSDDGRCLSYFARGRGVFPGVSPDYIEFYMRVLAGNCGSVVPPGVAPATAPALSHVSMTRRRFRVGPKATPVVARKKKKAKVGTTFRFTLNETAAVAIRIDRLTKGRRVGKRCVKPKAKLRHHKACTRATKRGTLTRKSLAAGASRVAFSGRIGKRKLAPGRYRATLTATASGLKSKAVKLSFTIVR